MIQRSLFLCFILMMTQSLMGMKTHENTLYTTMLRHVHEQNLITFPDYTPESLAIINHAINPYATSITDIPQFLEMRTRLYPDLDFTILQRYNRQLFSKALKSKEYPDCGLPQHVIHDIKRQGASRTYKDLKNHDFKKLCEYLDYVSVYDEILVCAEELWNSYSLPLQLAFLALLEKKYHRSTLPFVALASMVQIYGTAALIHFQPLHTLTPPVFFLLLCLEKIICLAVASSLLTHSTEWKQTRDMLHVWLLLSTSTLHVEEYQKQVLGQRTQKDRFLAHIITHFKKKLRDAYE